MVVLVLVVLVVLVVFGVFVVVVVVGSGGKIKEGTCPRSSPQPGHLSLRPGGGRV